MLIQLHILTEGSLHLFCGFSLIGDLKPKTWNKQTKKNPPKTTKKTPALLTRYRANMHDICWCTWVRKYTHSLSFIRKQKRLTFDLYHSVCLENTMPGIDQHSSHPDSQHPHPPPPSYSLHSPLNSPTRLPSPTSSPPSTHNQLRCIYAMNL